MRQGSVLSMALLVAGTAVGAGILGIPMQAGIAGIIPSMVGIITVWFAMLCAGLILARSLISVPHQKEDLPSLFQRELGLPGKWLSTIGYLIIFYGLMTAYLEGSVSVLGSLLDLHKGTYLLLAFFLPATALALFGLPVVRQGNAVIMGVLGLSFIFLLGMACREMDLTRLKYTDWSYFPAIFPIITCTFGYGVIIPTVCKSLNGDMRRITKALVWGTLIPVGISVLWIMAIVGSVPLQGSSSPDSLAQAFMNSEPATVLLANITGSNSVIIAGLIFSLCAILTSYLAVSTSLMSFLQDLLSPLLPHRSYWIRAALVFLPPLVVVIVSAGLFLTALDLVGGLGIALIFGLCPALINLKRRSESPRSRVIIGTLLLIFFGLILILELGQELDLLKIHSAVENWKINHP